jgi:hypothetical protein
MAKTKKHKIILPGSKEWSEPDPKVDAFMRKVEARVDAKRLGETLKTPISTPEPADEVDCGIPSSSPATGEFHEKPLTTNLDVASHRVEGILWKKRIEAGEVKPIGREDIGLIAPIKCNPHADRVLFMLSTVDGHVYARSIGSANGGYVSNIIHGVRTDGGIRWDEEPLFNDGVSREDPRVTKLDGRIYMTYTRVEPRSEFNWDDAAEDGRDMLIEALRIEDRDRRLGIEWLDRAMVERKGDTIMLTDDGHFLTLEVNAKGDMVIVNVDGEKSFDFDAKHEGGSLKAYKEGVGVGLASMPADNPADVTEHGTLMSINEVGVDSKDAVILPERVNGKVQVLVRLKPGIQVVEFDSIEDVVKLAEGDAEGRERFWRNMRLDYMRDPERYNHLHPNTEEMRLWEARWKPIIEERIAELIREYEEDDGIYEMDVNSPCHYGTGPAPIPVERDGERYWLCFHHRGQRIGELTREGRRRKELEHERVDELKFYCIIPTLHEYENPTKLVAVSPMPLSMPSVERYEQRSDQGMRHPFNHEDAVPHVAITAGAVVEKQDDIDKIVVPVGVNDVYTVMKRFDKDELIDWMLEHGRVKNAA